MLFEFFISIFFFKREELRQIFLEVFEVIGIFYFFKGVRLVFLFGFCSFIHIFWEGELAELNFPVVFCLDVGIEGWVAEIGLAAVTREVPTVFFGPGPAAAFRLVAFILSILLVF